MASGGTPCFALQGNIAMWKLWTKLTWLFTGFILFVQSDLNAESKNCTSFDTNQTTFVSW